MNIVTIVFEPERKRVNTPKGNTIFEVAKKAGVNIRSECGGKGSCGRCRVITRSSVVLGKLTDAEKEYLSESEIELGYRLACQAKALGDVTVLIPPESRLGSRKI